ncbi:MAG: TiaS agmantine-binding domain-containing protein [Candidatus Hodarchaeales archaeon]
MDDTDSDRGFCTTYIGAKITEYLLNDNITLLDFPLLIRLNPNIPFKTRGNGAVCIRILIEPENVDNLILNVKTIFEDFTDFSSPTTNPSLIFWKDSVTTEVKKLAKDALYSVIPLELTKNIVNKENVKVYAYNNKQGIVGALSAIGTELNNTDHTFELITYRNPHNKSNLRNENVEKIWEILESSHPYLDTFSNADIKHRVLKIIPHGVDPVFCGIRGNSTKGIISFWNQIQPQPSPELTVIFRTNQGTDQHLIESKHSHKKILDLLIPYYVVNFEGEVQSNPKWDIGGHLSFNIKINNKILPCYAYEPTKHFRKHLEKLIPGDIINIGGNLRPPGEDHPMCINLEKVTIIGLADDIKSLNPLCPACNKRVKSLGRDQGYRCPSCRKRYKKHSLFIEKRLLKREIKLNEFFLPAISAQRHLTKPKERYGKENRNFNFSYQKYKEEFNKLNNKK